MHRITKTSLTIVAATAFVALPSAAIAAKGGNGKGSGCENRSATATANMSATGTANSCRP